jgi:hypothetical protein
MEYKFGIGTVNYPDGYTRKFPSINIEDSTKYGMFFNAEIANINHANYVKELVDDIEKVMLGIHEQSDFGFELYSIECKKESTNVVNIFENNKIEAVIPTQEVYELMRDWRDYLIEWENNKIK